jgi:guanylate kinase
MKADQPRVYILFGAPGSGKSTALKHLAEHSNRPLSVIAKETTRERRDDDGPDILNVSTIAADCDVRYYSYGYEYGLRTSEIWRAFERGASAGIIVNDIRTLRILKQRFGVLAVIIYVHSNVDPDVDPDRLREIVSKRYPSKTPTDLEADLKRRFEKINTIHRKYIENTALFDGTILNLYGEGQQNSLEALSQQLDNLLESAPPVSRGERSPVRVFLIVGASFSGKDELVTAMQSMEPSRIQNYMKGTNRPERQDDHGELRHYDGELPEAFDIVYGRQNFTYGIASKELWQNLANAKISLLVVSDPMTIDLLIERFGRVCTVIYLHANFNRTEMRKQMSQQKLDEDEIKKRLQAVDDLHQLYVQKTTLFQHVLLNTREPEDLYDQAFNILDHYC